LSILRLWTGKGVKLHLYLRSLDSIYISVHYLFPSYLSNLNIAADNLTSTYICALARYSCVSYSRTGVSDAWAGIVAASERIIEDGRLRVVADVALLLVAPVVLIILATLPIDFRRSMAFSYTEPTVLTAFTAHYIHLTVPHLVGNLAGFLLLSTLAYGLSCLAERRWLFIVASLTFLLAFPLVLSALNLAVPRDAIGYGFSGVTMAFFAYIVVMLFTAIDKTTDLHVRPYLPAIFIISVAYISLLIFSLSAISVPFVGAAVFMIAVYVRNFGFEAIHRVRSELSRLCARPLVGELVVVATIVSVIYPVVGFPASSPTGVQVNVYVHFLGYALAFIATYISLFLEENIICWTRSKTDDTTSVEPL